MVRKHRHEVAVQEPGGAIGDELLQAVRLLADQDGDGWPAEDPADVWITAPAGTVLAGQKIADVSAHVLSEGWLAIDVTPWWADATAVSMAMVMAP